MDPKHPSHPAPYAPPFPQPRIRGSQLPGKAVSKATKVTGKRIGGALRAEQARQQKRRDSRH